MQTNQAPKLPTALFDQILARLKLKTPRIFNILTGVLTFLATLATAEEVYEKTLNEPPIWLLLVGYILKASVVLSGLITAQSAITGATPPLGDDQLPTFRTKDQELPPRTYSGNPDNFERPKR